MRRRLAALDVPQQLLTAVVLALVLGAVTVAVPALNSAGLLLACGALVATVAVLVQWLWQARATTDWTHTFDTPAQTRGSDIRLARIAGDVRSAADGDPTAARRVHDTVASLAADQLHRHVQKLEELS